MKLLAAVSLLLAGLNAILVRDQVTEPSTNLSFLAPYVFAAAFAVALASLMRCRKPFHPNSADRLKKYAFALVSLNFLTACWLVLPTAAVWVSSAQKDGGTPATLSIMTANLWRNPEAADAFVKLVDREQPDLLFVQEAYDPWASELRTRLPEYNFVAGCALPHTCNSVILSKGLQVELIEGDASGFASARVIPGDGSRLDENLLIVGVHISRTPRSEALRQLSDVRALIAGENGPILVVGDFNKTPWDPILQRFVQGADLKPLSGVSPTWPTRTKVRELTGLSVPVPGVAIDHVMGDHGWVVSRESRRADYGSDHYAQTIHVARSGR